MTRTTFRRRLVLICPMTINTPPHLQRIHLLNAIHSFHRSMATLTLNPFRQMPTMTEIDKVRQIVHTHPLNGTPLGIHLLQLLNHRFVVGHHRVTIHTDIHRRDRGVPPLFRIRMTVEARNVVISGMQAMTKGNRLLRCVASIVPQVAQPIDHPAHQDNQHTQRRDLLKC